MTDTAKSIAPKNIFEQAAAVIAPVNYLPAGRKAGELASKTFTSTLDVKGDTSGAFDLPPVPKMGNPLDAAAKARAGEIAKAKRFGGRGSTILTGALGIPGAAVTQKKTLLGQ